jgi:5'-deoxynucleotidase YfbR-like HD superfamily hydrolase
MKLIQRLSLDRNVIQENIQEHRLQAAMIAHSLVNPMSFPVS